MFKGNEYYGLKKKAGKGKEGGLGMLGVPCKWQY